MIKSKIAALEREKADLTNERKRFGNRARSKSACGP